MSAGKHTPGPWYYPGRTVSTPSSLLGTIHQNIGTGKAIAHVTMGGGNGDADGRLIAAAPELLAAATDALWALDNVAAVLSAAGIESTLSDPTPALRDAIAKATPSTPRRHPMTAETRAADAWELADYAKTVGNLRSDLTKAQLQASVLLEAVKEAEPFLRSGDIDSRGGKIELSRLANVMRDALASIQALGAGQP